MNYLFFDTETNGFPPKARMTQLAFMLIDEDGNVIEEYENLIRPDGWVIPKEQFFIDNNMSTERCQQNGVPVFEALRKLQDTLKKADYKVAHNINFDNQIILKELKLAEITHQLFQFKKGVDTMKSTTNFCKLPGRYPGKYKWPKLTELHQILFKEEFNAHDALDDVKAMARCFFELKQKHNFFNNI